MEQRLTDLEIRLTHHEAAVDELTRTVVDQANRIDVMKRRIEQLEAALREATPGASDGPEPPPPHY